MDSIIDGEYSSMEAMNPKEVQTLTKEQKQQIVDFDERLRNSFKSASLYVTEATRGALDAVQIVLSKFQDVKVFKGFLGEGSDVEEVEVSDEKGSAIFLKPSFEVLDRGDPKEMDGIEFKWAHFCVTVGYQLMFFYGYAALQESKMDFGCHAGMLSYVEGTIKKLEESFGDVLKYRTGENATEHVDDWFLHRLVHYFFLLASRTIGLRRHQVELNRLKNEGQFDLIHKRIAYFTYFLQAVELERSNLEREVVLFHSSGRVMKASSMF